MLGAKPASPAVYPSPPPPVNVPTGSRSRTPSGLPRPEGVDAVAPVEDELPRSRQVRAGWRGPRPGARREAVPMWPLVAAGLVELMAERHPSRK